METSQTTGEPLPSPEIEDQVQIRRKDYRSAVTKAQGGVKVLLEAESGEPESGQ